MDVWRGALFLPMVFLVIQKAGGQLVENFYESSCPNVEGIVKEMVFAKYMQANFSVPATLRLFFHDCFIEGCDASIMIASPNGDAEKDAVDNLSLAGDGFDMVNRAKQAVEAACPGVVSCADILAIAARDVVVLAGGPSFSVELGRRDGLISQASRVAENIPEPSFNLTQLTTIFAKNNLSQTDMIALSGAHTLGVSHCARIADRLYGFPPDPYLDKNYKGQLMLKCPQTAPTDGVVTMDSTPLTFDNLYYKSLEERKGLFISDEVLFVESASKLTVQDFADNPDNFSRAFIAGMVKLGRAGVKTGVQGEIRRNCAAFNSWKARSQHENSVLP